MGDLQGSSHKARRTPSMADKVNISLVCGQLFNHFPIYMMEAKRGQPGVAASPPGSRRCENHNSRLITLQQCLSFPSATLSVDNAENVQHKHCIWPSFQRKPAKLGLSAIPHRQNTHLAAMTEKKKDHFPRLKWLLQRN